MKLIRGILFVFALAVFGAGGAARAEEQSSDSSVSVSDSVQVAQAQESAYPGDDRPATLGDIRGAIRDAENRINARIDGMEARMNLRMDQMGERMDRTDAQIESLRQDVRTTHTGLYAILAVLLTIALGGLLTIINLLFKERRGAMISGAAAAFLLVAGGTLLLGSCEAEAAKESDFFQSFHKQSQHQILDGHFINVRKFDWVGDLLRDLSGGREDIRPESDELKNRSEKFVSEAAEQSGDDEEDNRSDGKKIRDGVVLVILSLLFLFALILFMEKRGPKGRKNGRGKEVDAE